MKNKIYISFVVAILSLFAPIKIQAIEALGGEITWKCAGGNNFIFELVLYRDCNSADLTSLTENIRVWNHSTISDIAVDFVSKTNISPSCTQNAGSLPPLSCGSGDNGGNGLGAVEKFIYQSNPITLVGIPPQDGWIFTYETSARKSSITNIFNPTAAGMTLVAKMFEINVVQNSCLDNSPQFLENPYLVVCAGTPYLYMPNISDQDLDSLSFSLVNPLNNFPTGTFNPPTNPIETQFIPSFSFNSPTPGLSINGSNSSFSLNPEFGDMSFTSFTPGEFVVKILVSSFRNGKLIAQVEREMVIFVVSCGDNNNVAPIIDPAVELGSSFAGNFTAGNLVSFTVNSTDLQFLQDGITPQQNSSSVSSIVLSNPILNADFQGSTNLVSWQSTCSDLKNNFGNEFDSVTYNFVLKVSDNYCQVPKTTYQRFQIHLTTNTVIDPEDIEFCINTLANGDLEVTWTQVPDPAGDFLAYELHSLQDGLLGTYNDITDVFHVIPAVNEVNDFFVKLVSGSPCAVALSSDTVQNLYLSLFNPADGTATLTWNQPVPQNTNSINDYYQIYREYPALSNNWILLDSVPFGTNLFIDTIDICSAFLNYQVVLPTVNCPFTSNIIGANLEDLIAPFAPIISSVSIDTITGFATINWIKPSNTDIEGYVIYFNNIEIDTVFGINNLTYSYEIINNSNPLNFSVAAFDSCSSQFNPTFNQTSGRSQPHTSMFLSHDYDVCSKTVELSWTNYLGWLGIERFDIFGRKENGLWENFGTANLENQFQILLEEFQNYTFVIQAFDSLSSSYSFSNAVSFFTTSTSKPDFNYIRVATVLNENVEIKHEIELTSGVSELALERLNNKGEFEEIQRIPMTPSAIFIDEDVQVSEQSYSYQIRLIDSCGNLGSASNIAKTILLQVETDHLNLKNFLTWSRYEGFNGSILYYNLYRGIDGNFDPNPFISLPPDQLYFEDLIKSNLEFSGRICYYVQAIESTNMFAFNEISQSNIVCPVFEPLIYVPNAFTPNADNLNETFIPKFDMIDVNQYRFTIFDRWGQVIFQTDDSTLGWDGKIDLSNKIAPNGTYMYVVQIKDGNGQELIKRGNVNLIR